MTPSRWRLLSLVALAVPIALTAAASGASPGFPALALASAAGGAALLLAGPVFRRILAVLVGLLGGCVVLVATATTTEQAGLLVLAIVAGALQIVVAGGIVATAGRWPAASGRYSRTRLEGDAASDWDALSAGEDPTQR